MEPMTKNRAIDAIAESTGVTKKDVKAVIEAFDTVASDALKQGAPVAIGSLGRLMTGERKARSMRSPATGEMIDVPASRTVRFKPSKPFKEAIA